MAQALTQSQAQSSADFFAQMAGLMAASGGVLKVKNAVTAAPASAAVGLKAAAGFEPAAAAAPIYVPIPPLPSAEFIPLPPTHTPGTRSASAGPKKVVVAADPRTTQARAARNFAGSIFSSGDVLGGARSTFWSAGLAAEVKSELKKVEPLRKRAAATKKKPPPPAVEKAEAPSAQASAKASAKADAKADAKAVVPDPNDVPKPKRPLSAYNFFFQHERARLLALLSSGEMLEGRIPPPVGLTLEGVHRTLRSAPKDNDAANGGAAGRSHKKGHGKVGFTDLVKHMAVAWKKADPATKAVFEEISDDDKARYRREMRAYRVKVKAVKSLKRKADQQSGEQSKPVGTLEERLRAAKRAKMEAEAKAKAAEAQAKTKADEAKLEAAKTAAAAAGGSANGNGVSLKQMLRKKRTIESALSLSSAGPRNGLLACLRPVPSLPSKKAPKAPAPRMRLHSLPMAAFAAPAAPVSAPAAISVAPMPAPPPTAAFALPLTSVNLGNVVSFCNHPAADPTPLRNNGVVNVAAMGIAMPTRFENVELFNFLNNLNWNA